MKNRIIVTVADYQRLMDLMEFTSVESRKQDVADKLARNLSSAKRLKQEDIAHNVVTMNSRVKLRELVSKRETEITITYPQEAEPRERRVSVLSEIGIALLGRKENELVSWRIPDGVGNFEITKVTYQPEAAGHYFL